MTNPNSRGQATSLQSETLNQDELVAITGYQIPSRQIQWLSSNGWEYVLTGARRPIVGRIYARLKLAGVKHPRQVQWPRPGHSTCRRWAKKCAIER